MKTQSPPAAGIHTHAQLRRKLCLDKKRCPITFYWWAESHGTCKPAAATQLTIERASPTGRLQLDSEGNLHEIYVPTAYYRMDNERLIQSVTERQDTILSLHNPGTECLWHGPYVLEDTPAPELENEWFRLQAPRQSDGLSLSHLVSARLPHTPVSKLS